MHTHRARETDEVQATGRAVSAPEHAAVPRERLGVGAATRAYVDALGPHDSTEDMHPYRLDETGSVLAEALSSEALARRAAYRDARDAA